MYFCQIQIRSVPVFNYLAASRITKEIIDRKLWGTKSDVCLCHGVLRNDWKPYAVDLRKLKQSDSDGWIVLYRAYFILRWIDYALRFFFILRKEENQK